MTELATFADEPTMLASTQRLAWGIVLGSFAMLCALCMGTSVAGYFFLFNSSVPLEAKIQTGRGTALLTDASFNEQGVRLFETITNRPSLISMDAQSQSSISFFTSSDNNRRLLAVVTLKQSSEARFTTGTMPRFSWSNGMYEIEWRDYTGKMDVFVINADRHPILMTIDAAAGARVQITRNGRYSLDSTDARLRVVNYGGEAIIYGTDRNKNRIVLDGQEGAFIYGIGEPVISAARRNLLINGAFTFDTIASDSQGESSYPPGRWGCTNLQDELPRGAFRVDYWEGRSALRLVRNNNASTHGETRCLQPLLDEQANVGDYNYLEFTTTFLISYQSLSRCGIKGSECPLMLRLTYLDTSGVEREWFQGFYYAIDQQNDYPLRCLSCTQDHLQIQSSVWYTFETGNLLNIIPPDSRPVRITQVEFYASGHQYDVFVSEVALYAGLVEAIPASVTNSN